MTCSVREIVEAFELLYETLQDPAFSKSLRLKEWGERDLLPLVRTFLLGWFGRNVEPEVAAALPGSWSGKGRIDFVIGGVAVEFAVRKPRTSAATMSAVVNSDEIKKLMKFRGKALLVLFDFSRKPYSEEQVERFREWPSLGKGAHKKSPFHVAYFHRGTRRRVECGLIRKHIRVG